MRLNAIILLAALALIGIAAVALPLSANDITPDSIEMLLGKTGTEVKRGTRKDGVPFFAFEIDGNASIIALYGCTPGPCSRSMLYAYYPGRRGATLQAIGNWNRDHRHMRAYLAENGDATIESDLVLNGASMTTVREWLALWRRQVPLFLAHTQE